VWRVKRNEAVLGDPATRAILSEIVSNRSDGVTQRQTQWLHPAGSTTTSLGGNRDEASSADNSRPAPKPTPNYRKQKTYIF
jgi:hypothetical protein